MKPLQQKQCTRCIIKACKHKMLRQDFFSMLLIFKKAEPTFQSAESLCRWEKDPQWAPHYWSFICLFFFHEWFGADKIIKHILSCVISHLSVLWTHVFIYLFLLASLLKLHPCTHTWECAFLTSSLSVLMSFCAAAAAAGTGTPGLLVTSTGALGRMSAGIRPGDTGPR